MPIKLADTSVLHLDADAFFASVEQRDDARLRGKPVAVGTGVVASCSYEARRYGVSTGMRLLDARRQCRDLIVLPGEYPRYEQAARRILAVCEEKTPLIEVAALDDLYLDLKQQDQPEHVAGQLRMQIHDEVRLSVSIGIGANKMVAKVATREAKPGRQVRVPAGGEQAYLAPRPTRVLPGVGPKVDGRLERLNVRKVGQVAEMPLAILRGLFGNQGKTLHEQSHGIDDRPVQPRRPPQSISRCTSFDPPVSDLLFLQAMLDYLLERAASWMRYNQLATRGFVVKIRYGDDPQNEVDLRKLGPVGSFTFAEYWKAIKPSAEQQQLFDLLMERLKDDDEAVKLQADGYFEGSVVLKTSATGDAAVPIRVKWSAPEEEKEEKGSGVFLIHSRPLFLF